MRPRNEITTVLARLSILSISCKSFYLLYLSELARVTKSTGGERGIRTPDTGLGPYNGLANRRLQPLGHLSATCSYSLSHARSPSELFIPRAATAWRLSAGLVSGVCNGVIVVDTRRGKLPITDVLSARRAVCRVQARMAPQTGAGQSREAPALTSASILAAISAGNAVILRDSRSMKALTHSKIEDRLPLVSLTRNIR